ncbi:MAG: tRNA uridine-5-carboxymethylaminomethyl(34) synthesis enzyme MnmG [Fusobacterium perfoetens]|uniref:tRNA uridine-5-carboxymethylaminomethyl(34) synthesis enzyme MnmG n=1 Tax=Fusobacterium perfoetens TaxID=852 RepID=UPI0023F42160|nr:tRNA uridine-5-carboxymethylaminomethyl(34) synthesis enzyme MnmG [Fusobacterium perfoetens]MCI6153418.1 tRNA uridine-5-carboxymethylaminomethyl(34) synthesis enzyme MnmG [Fusobacterium perfoetens]MDY3238439.1 tRNA uridine-5-carboxymethylaminomethyl(34) synthesis enzyme MnmG [Fusobacterium perfoetens]
MMKFDVIVVGAGHAGCEAALATARMGMKTAIFTISLDKIGYMSCNPSLGGPAKSHLVREIDALGGEIAKNIDKTFIQIRVLNTKKGPAVRSLRAQADKAQYTVQMKKTLENTENLDVIQGMVTDIIIEDGKAIGVKTREGVEYRGKVIIIATGTFMRGLIHIGESKFQGGRLGELSSEDLPLSLEKIGIKLGRFKTGTPARIDERTIDFSKMEEQPGDTSPLRFSNSSSYEELAKRKQIPCHLLHTNEKVHDIIRANKDRSPLYNGTIVGTGPRYCPSIEDKIFKYPDKKQHHIFLEKEGYDTNEIYVAGLSNSLPADVQYEILHSIEGLENAKIMRYAYAIEYDYVATEELTYSLENKNIKNLYTAGQINGTSGYEEAAAQGIMAGINAARKIQGKEPIILDRADSYIGTLIDDIVSKGTNEPYRMFTARSEYRLILREDNADLRLSKIGYEVGLVSKEEYEKVLFKEKVVKEVIEKLKKQYVGSSNSRVNEILEKYNEKPVSNGISLFEFLRRPDVTYKDIKYVAKLIEDFSLEDYIDDIEYQIEIQVKYSGYIERAMKAIEKHKTLEDKKIPENIDYDSLENIPREAKEKLKAVRPMNIGQASRISGVSPADIQVLLIYLKMRGKN